MSRILYRERLIAHPELALTASDPQSLLERERVQFPELSKKRIHVYLLRQPTLACIQHSGESASILIHSVLNHPQTPEEVMALIYLHELLHLRIPPREVDGHTKTHPPEFWEAQRLLIPELSLRCGWIVFVLGPCLREDSKQEATFVKSSWKRLMNQIRPSFQWFRQFCDFRSSQDEKEGERYL